MPKSVKGFKDLRQQIDNFITLYGVVEVEKSLRIVVMGVRHSGIENIRTGA